MIRVRSTYEITHSEAGLQFIDYEVYIYTGTKDTDKGSPVYTIRALAATIGSGGNPETVLDLAPFVRDYLKENLSFNNDYLVNTVWVSYIATRSINGVAQTPDAIQHLNASLGYHDFLEGANFVGLNSGTYLDLFERNIIVKPKGESVTIPVNNDISKIYFANNGEIVYTLAPSGNPNESDEVFEYVSDGLTNQSNLKDVTIRNGGEYFGVECLDLDQRRFICLDTPIDYDEIIIERYDSETANVTAVSQRRSIKVRNVDTHYKKYKLVFINKAGAFEDIWFYGNDEAKLKTESNEVKRNIRSGGTYDTFKHIYFNTYKSGRRSLKINSGFVPEELNSAFEELFLSEFVWLVSDGYTIPINIKEERFTQQTQLKSKLINYEIEIEFSFDVINNYL